MTIKNNLLQLKASLPPSVTLIAVTKTHPVEKLEELYNAGHRLFGENKVQEMLDKYAALPKDIQWHLIGHLQTNKVKFIAPFVKLIHSVDSLKLLQEINKQAGKNNRIIDCLLQVHIAEEETKFGFDLSETEQLLDSGTIKQLPYVRIRGLMGMASNTDNKEQIAAEFKSLAAFYKNRQPLTSSNVQFEILSMGMSSDFEIALRNGSTMIRVGSLIFGKRS
jgi:pyridoxal phosphate enzyme (YggS family)